MILTYDLTVHPLFSLFIFFIEILITVFSLLQIIQSSIFFVNCTLLGTFVYTSHVKEVNKSVKLLVYNKGKKGNLSFSSVYQVIYRQLKEHNLVCYLVMHACKKLFGNVLLVFLLIHIPTNIYLLQQNAFASPPFLTMLILWLVILAQCVAAIIVFLPLAWMTKVFHSPNKFILKLQMLMKGKQWLTYKFKYDDLFNRLHQGPKNAIFIGNFQAITFSTALEVN